MTGFCWKWGQIIDLWWHSQDDNQESESPRQSPARRVITSVTRSAWWKRDRIAKYIIKKEWTNFTTRYRCEWKKKVTFLFCLLSYLCSPLSWPGLCKAENMHKCLIHESPTQWIHILQEGEVLMFLCEGKKLYTLKMRCGKWQTASKWAQQSHFLLQQRETLLALSWKPNEKASLCLGGYCKKATHGIQHSVTGVEACRKWAQVESGSFLLPQVPVGQGELRITPTIGQKRWRHLR